MKLFANPKVRIIAGIFCVLLALSSAAFGDEKEDREIKGIDSEVPSTAVTAVLDVAFFGIAGGPLFAIQMLEGSIEKEMLERAKIYSPDHVYQEGGKLTFTFNNGQQVLTIRQNKAELYGYLRFIDHEFESRLYVKSFSIDHAMNRLKEMGTIRISFVNVPIENNNKAILTNKGYVIIEDLQDERIYVIRLPYAEELAKKLGIY